MALCGPGARLRGSAALAARGGAAAAAALLRRGPGLAARGVAAGAAAAEPRAEARALGPFRPALRVAQAKDAAKEGQELEVRGWVRTVRAQKGLAFLEVNDGSCLASLQVVLVPDAEGYDLLASGRLATGAAVRVSGELVASKGGNQSVELKARSLELVGECDGTYPMQKKRHTLEFLREQAHLRPRTNLIGAVTRVRNTLAFATHEFFQEHGFQYIHTPLISTSDCEGAGEMFQVTTLLSELDAALGAGPGADPGEARAAVAAQGAKVKELKAAAKGGGASDADVQREVAQLLALKAELEAAEDAAAPKDLPKTAEGAVDYSQDFFGSPAFLTVSGQLNGEIYATAMRDIYTFGPTFRAENSNTARHLAEFWMIEPELAFTDLEGMMACAQAYMKHCVAKVMADNREDLQFFDRFTEKGLLARLGDIAAKDFATVTYTEAIEHLLAADRAFEFPVAWGVDLASEHERYLTEEVYGGTPLFVTDYPKEIKAFYMRLNEDGQTVAATDLLVPRIGELIGGSQREERLDVLEARIDEAGLEQAPYWWYKDLRRYGTVPHAGFGLGFERLVQLCTGVENIRDVIPFPRYPGNAKF